MSGALNIQYLPRVLYFGCFLLNLSAMLFVPPSLPFITATADGPKHIETTLTRAKFEELCSDLLDRYFNSLYYSSCDCVCKALI